MKNILPIFLLLIMINLKAVGQKPAAFSTSKPWAYWWWPGSAVNEKSITYNLEAFAKQGFGGLHIIPIYGAKGFENQFLNYLSADWKAKFAFTLKEAQRLHLGIDLTLGTGWPFGGPQITPLEAAKAYQIFQLTIPEGATLPVLDNSLAKFPGSILTAISVFENGIYKENLFDLFQKKQLATWHSKSDSTHIYLMYQTLTKQMVKRAAPGGEGLVMDHFNADAFDAYKVPFTALLKKSHRPLRAIYNDSYEAFGANWTSDFFDQFVQLNGYDLRAHLDVMYKSQAQNETENQIWADYHRTISQLLMKNFTQPFAAFAKGMGFLSRDQAHGSPGNLLDLYGAVDIPEAEFFGSKPYKIPNYRVDPEYDSLTFGIPDIRALKLASSAANLVGKKLVTSETATWLGNHFKVSLSQVKPIIDEVFVGGVNHVFFHGATFSPPEVKWPGWLFYASTNFNPQSHFWEALPELNKYIETCQSFLQNNATDSDLLLYFPMEEIWHQRNGKGKMHTLDLHANSRNWLKNTPFGKWAQVLQDRGYQTDYISDDLLKTLKPNANKTFTASSGNVYKTILIPPINYLSTSTLELLADWVKKGYPVYFLEKLPEKNILWNESEVQKSNWNTLREQLVMNVLSDPRDVLARKGVAKEEMSELGLSFIRKRENGNYAYFVTNLSNTFNEGFVNFARKSNAYSTLNPMNGQVGQLPLDKMKGAFVQLLPGQSVIIRTVKAKKIQKMLPVISLTLTNITPSSKINVDFVKGAPELPKSMIMESLDFWTKDSSTHRFWGTGKYSFDFDLTAEEIKYAKVLHLDQLKDWAKVTINGKLVGKIWAIPFQLDIPNGVLKEHNRFEIEVTNLSANRIRDLDKKGVVWKNFHEINFVDIRYKPFDASNWAIDTSGLKGNIFFTNR
ncbi:glycosyl hydrolase [Aquirufa sp. ROCK-SH2]